MKITFIEPNGIQRDVDDAQEGEKLMHVAKRNRIAGIEADCGGACICATCHVYIERTFMNTLTPPSEEEESMLDFVFSVQENSRLSCQIVLSSDMDRMIVTVPKT